LYSRSRCYKNWIVWEPLTDTKKTISQPDETNRQVCITQESDDSDYNLKINGKIPKEGGTSAQVLATLNTNEGKNKTIDTMIERYTLEKYPTIFAEN
jgi:hypothetical protein